jgi:hypothetical protein
MIKIYHANKEIFSDSVWYGYSMGLSMEEIIVKFQNGEYFEAGQIDTNDLEQAYHLSQNLCARPKGWEGRSTSVGDIIENDDGIWIVANAGFDQIKIKAAA